MATLATTRRPCAVLALLVPLTLLVETLAAVSSVRMAWLMRLALAAIVAPILLHDTVYLTVLDGRNAAEWSPSQATMILCGLAAVLALIWAALSALAARTSTPAVYNVLILDAYATAVTVMLSGYFFGGLLGLGLAGAITGAALAAYVVPPQPPARGGIGMSVIGIFSVVLMGYFFGALSLPLAACLLLAPLWAWIVELPRLRIRTRLARYPTTDLCRCSVDRRDRHRTAAICRSVGGSFQVFEAQYHGRPAEVITGHPAKPTTPRKLDIRY